MRFSVTLVSISKGGSGPLFSREIGLNFFCLFRGQFSTMISASFWALGTSHPFRWWEFKSTGIFLASGMAASPKFPAVSPNVGWWRRDPSFGPLFFLGG